MPLFKKTFGIIFATCLLASSPVAAGDPVKVFTSVFPPIVTDDAQTPGYAYEILEQVFAIANIEAEFIQVPWERAQKSAQKEPESFIFPLTRTPTRENFYNWGFVLFKTQTHFVTLDGTKLTKETARDKLVGVQRGSSWDNWLSENNYPHVHRSTNEGHTLVRMLKAKRIEAWYAEKSIAQNILPMNKIYDATFSDPILSFQTYLATNKQVPSPHLEKLHKAFNHLIKSGGYQKIMERYNISTEQVLPELS